MPELYYKTRHEHVRKDIERAFGQMVKQFGILDQPLQNWYLKEIQNILGKCIILHNMVVEKRKENYKFTDLRDVGVDEEEEEDEPPTLSLFSFGEDDDNANDDQQAARAAQVAHLSEIIEISDLHDDLQADLTHHLFHVYKQSRKVNS